MVLVGDAVHAASPASGQGASMAFEDAVTLARCLRTAPRRPRRSPPTNGCGAAGGGRRHPRQAGRRREGTRAGRPVGARPPRHAPGGREHAPGRPGPGRLAHRAPHRLGQPRPCLNPVSALPDRPGKVYPWPGPASSRSHSPSMTAPATRCGLRRGRRTARSGRRSSAPPRTTSPRSTSSRSPRRSRRTAAPAPTTTSPTTRSGRSWPGSVPRT